MVPETKQESKNDTSFSRSGNTTAIVGLARAVANALHEFTLRTVLVMGELDAIGILQIR